MTHRNSPVPHRPFAALGLIGMAWVTGLAVAPNRSSAYEVVTVVNGGTIDGYVTLSGNAPSRSPLKVTKDQKTCGDSIADPTYAVGGNGGLKNVIVYLADITKGKAVSMGPIAFVGEGCMFNPRVQAATVGQEVNVSSRDSVLHTFHPQEAKTSTTIYNLAIPFPGITITKSLPSSAGLIKIKDDAHEWMRAWILEFDHPYFATTDGEGHFTIKDIPPGSYTLVAWHEGAAEQTAAITVTPASTVRSTMTLQAAVAM